MKDDRLLSEEPVDDVPAKKNTYLRASNNQQQDLERKLDYIRYGICVDGLYDCDGSQCSEHSDYWCTGGGFGETYTVCCCTAWEYADPDHTQQKVDNKGKCYIPPYEH